MIIDSDENKRLILARFLEICAFEGINDEVLESSMLFCNIDPKYKNIIFENGILSLIEFFIEENNKKLAQIIEEEPNFSALKIRDKIKFSLYKLFEIQQEHKMALQRMRNFYIDLGHLKTTKYGARPMFLALKNFGFIADFIWKQIGDQSSDFNYYTKRLMLSNIILSSFFVFTKDESADLVETKAFIDKKIEKVMKFEKLKAKIRGFSSEFKKNSREFFIDDKGEIKNLKEIIKNLPFIRLFK